MWKFYTGFFISLGLMNYLIRIFSRLLLLIAIGCASASQSAELPQNISSTYSRYTNASGDRVIEFNILVPEFPQGFEPGRLWINTKLMDYELTSDSTAMILYALRSYPNSGRGMDPLPPGEAGNILYFEEKFSGKLELKKAGETHSLLLNDFKEVPHQQAQP